MPWGLKRYQQARDLHFITFSCYRRQPLLASPHAKRLFEEALEQARRQYGFWVTGYVVMPEHVHLLVSEPERAGCPTHSRGSNEWDRKRNGPGLLARGQS